MKNVVKKVGLSLFFLGVFCATLGSTRAYAAVSNVSPQDEERLISGVVVDSQKERLPGVRINVKGTPRGGITDMDGYFRVC